MNDTMWFDKAKADAKEERRHKKRWVKFFFAALAEDGDSVQIAGEVFSTRLGLWV